MRKPTPDSVLYCWHRARLGAGSIADEVAPFPNDPQCGWYKRQLVKGGPFVPARIFLDRLIDEETGELMSDEVLRCEVGGISRDPEEEWQWLWSNPISSSEFQYMTAVAYHASFYEPNAPEANPRKKLDWSTVPPPIFNRSK